MKRKAVIPLLIVLLIVIWGGGFYLYQKTQDKSEAISKNKNNKSTTKEVTKTNISDNQEVVLKDAPKKYVYDETKGKERSFYADTSIFAEFQKFNQKVAYCDDKDDIAYYSVEDKTLFKKYSKTNDILEVGGSHILGTTIDYNGTLWGWYINQQTLEWNVISFDQGIKHKIHLDNDKLKKEYKKLWNGKVLLGKNNIYLLGVIPETSKKMFFIFDKTGKLLKEDSTIKDMELISNGELVSIDNKYGIMRWICDGDSIITEDLGIIDNFGPRDLSYDNANQQLYIRGNEGIRRYDINNMNEFETVFDFAVDTSIKDTRTITQFTAQEGKIYLLEEIWVKDKSGHFSGKFRIYTYTPKKAEKKESSITLTVPYKMNFLEEAVKLYEKKYPEREVKIEAAYNSASEFSNDFNNYADRMMTKILTGDYGDLIISSHGLKFTPLLRTDAYMDLTEWIKKVPCYDDLNQSALNALKIDGHLRALPLGINLYYYGINKELAKEVGITDYSKLTWNDLLDIALKWHAEGKTNHTILGVGVSGFDQLDQMINNNVNELINMKEKKCNLNQDWFKELVKKWKQVSDYGVLYGYNEKDLDVKLDDKASIMINGFEKGALLQTYSRRDLTNNWNWNDPSFETSQYYKTNDVIGATQEYLPGICGEKSENYCSIPSIMLSVNDQSKKKEEALQFMEFLLEDEVQSLDSLWGIPLNLKVDKKLWKKNTKRDEWKVASEQKYNEYYDMLSKNYDKIDTLYPNEYTHYISGPMQDYVDGKITLDQAIKKAEQDVWLHLNE
ncbi:extracellular solute-binding protein [Anaeromicropila herbilytica]|uniref:Extracellular solute-binding protein n=1 Tax=Anaeromicropila herbilytica TaxID=2785025 RepID=A0A7R7EIL7_9FIRM|nr:extracellular solute-binding protein [Anaeromicropila herbilytica]BCN29457.1 hypothetical protein bsdtb5_07520 [Anaeromicropila herbilytica]